MIFQKKYILLKIVYFFIFSFLLFFCASVFLLFKSPFFPEYFFPVKDNERQKIITLQTPNWRFGSCFFEIKILMKNKEILNPEKKDVIITIDDTIINEKNLKQVYQGELIFFIDECQSISKKITVNLTLEKESLIKGILLKNKLIPDQSFAFSIFQFFLLLCSFSSIVGIIFFVFIAQKLKNK